MICNITSLEASYKDVRNLAHKTVLREVQRARELTAYSFDDALASANAFILQFDHRACLDLWWFGFERCMLSSQLFLEDWLFHNSILSIGFPLNVYVLNSGHGKSNTNIAKILNSAANLVNTLNTSRRPGRREEKEEQQMREAMKRSEVGRGDMKNFSVQVYLRPVCPDLTRERYAHNTNSSMYVRMVAHAA